MSYLALYRKYRPKNLNEMVGQKNVIEVISNAIKNNKISHAYLFTGPRGTGKTSLAKIIAKMVNCTDLKDGVPCGKCYNCRNFDNNSDIIEIDAASNNGIEEIREIREKVALVPAFSKYKVYIIDEVHMLTTQAFNALLKTLEEPPEHIIFIFATTEFYKIPATILSRCQKFQFNKIDDELIVERLKLISKEENINVDESALYEIARLSDGGMRDSINYLDQLASLNKDLITIEDVFDINCSVSYEMINELLEYILNKDRLKIINVLEFIDKNGKNINKFIEELLIFVKDILIYKNTNKLTKIKSKNEKIIALSLDFTSDFIYKFIGEMNDLLGKIKVSEYPTILLMVSLLKKFDENTKRTVKKLDANETLEMKETLEKVNISAETEYDKNKIEGLKKIRINNTFSLASKEMLIKFKDLWKNLSLVSDDDLIKYVGLVADCLPVAVGDSYVMLVSKYESTATRINADLSGVETLIKKVYSKSYKIIALSENEWNSAKIEYINNRKKGIVYSYIEENTTEHNQDKNKKIDSPVDKLIEIVGEDIIEYK